MKNIEQERLDIIETMEKACFRYDYEEMFQFKKDYFSNRETFEVSNYSLFIETILTFLLKEALNEDVFPNKNNLVRFYKSATDKEKILKKIKLNVFYQDKNSLEIKRDVYSLINTNFLFKELNELNINRIKNNLKNISVHNLTVIFAFDDDFMKKTTYYEKKYWNDFIARSDYKYFLSFIKSRKIELLKKYSDKELEKNMILKAMCFNNEMLFFKKIVEKEILIDATKYVFYNYQKNGEFVYDELSPNESICSFLNMAKILDKKSICILEEDLLIDNELSINDWFNLFMTKKNISGFYNKDEDDDEGETSRLKTNRFKFQSQNLKYSRINYFQNINKLIALKLMEITDFLISNQEDKMADDFLDYLLDIEYQKTVSDDSSYRNKMVFDCVNKILDFKESRKNIFVKEKHLLFIHYSKICVKQQEIILENFLSKLEETISTLNDKEFKNISIGLGEMPLDSSSAFFSQSNIYLFFVVQEMLAGRFNDVSNEINYFNENSASVYNKSIKFSANKDSINNIEFIREFLFNAVFCFIDNKNAILTRDYYEENMVINLSLSNFLRKKDFEFINTFINDGRSNDFTFLSLNTIYNIETMLSPIYKEIKLKKKFSESQSGIKNALIKRKKI